jgi:membrane protein DedA with SNARE-associated domain
MFAPLLAGSLKIRWITFQIYDILALIFYASLFIFLGFHFNNQLGSLFLQEKNTLMRIDNILKGLRIKVLP